MLIVFCLEGSKGWNDDDNIIYYEYMYVHTYAISTIAQQEEQRQHIPPSTSTTPRTISVFGTVAAMMSKNKQSTTATTATNDDGGGDGSNRHGRSYLIPGLIIEEATTPTAVVKKSNKRYNRSFDCFLKARNKSSSSLTRSEFGSKCNGDNSMLCSKSS
mmetsp:Transcript_2733/g.4410  ORF Transcript_2733/g.4410 Transcript_2733/m.4410 type:complete len:159 (-) Transcript_2733:48-524(-)